MPSAAAIRLQIEAALAQRIPSALTPMARVVRPVASTGVAAVDALLEGGLPVGAITEMAGPESSGRTSLALSFLAELTRQGSVCAWVDVCDELDPVSAAAAGVDLSRLLWVRCGVAAPPQVQPDGQDFHLPSACLVPPPAKKGLHGGGFGPHPRTEIIGMAGAVEAFLRCESREDTQPEPLRRTEGKAVSAPMPPQAPRAGSGKSSGTPWNRMEQALRATDLLLQAGGFAAIVLDMASLAPQHALRVPLATWFRFRAAADRTRASLLLFTQQPCAKSSGELLLHFQPGKPRDDAPTVFTGMAHRVEVERRRFTQQPTNVIPMRKPPQKETSATWRTRSPWAGAR